MSVIKQCLVTGASGFIGQSLCQFLQKQGIKVRALSNNNTSNFCDETIRHDLCNPINKNLAKSIMKNVDTVFHLASVSYNNNRNVSSDTYWKLNVTATKTLVNLVSQANVERFIYFSSVKAIGVPTDHYGCSKQVAENVVLQSGKDHNLHVCILRPALVYGLPCLRGSLSSMLSGIKHGWFPPIPYQYDRSLVSIEGVVKAAWMVANDLKANGKVYTLSDQEFYSTREIYDAMRKLLGIKPISWSFPTWILYILAKVVDIIEYLTNKNLFFNTLTFKKLTNLELYCSESIKKDLGWVSESKFFKILPEIMQL